jgi:Uncharacterised nucleotidyltransferase
MRRDPAAAVDEAAASAPWPKLWQSVDALVARAPRDSDLQTHGVELLAEHRRRELDSERPPSLGQRRAVALRLTVVPTLQRVRAAYDGRLLLLKGPETAAHYPAPGLRGYNDLDLLVPDAGAAWRALLGAGFEPVGDPDLYIGIHHLRPLVAPGLPLAIELHDRPKWPAGVAAPSAAELFATAVPSTVGVDGIEALPAPHHALVLAAHSWAHEPLRRLRDLVDVAAVANATDRETIDGLAEAWHVERLWRTTAAALDALFADARTPWSLRLWARNVARVRERTVLENHATQWLSGFWSYPPRAATRRLVHAVAADLRPKSEEGWGQKARRSLLALRNAFVRRSEHDEMT